MQNTCNNNEREMVFLFTEKEDVGRRVANEFDERLS